METKKCPNCNVDIPLDATICPYCGKSFAEGKEKSAKKNNPSLSGNMTKSLIAGVLAILGIIIMLAYRAWLGLPIYLIGFIVAFLEVKAGHDAFGGSVIDYLKDAIKNGELASKITAIVVAVLPIALIIGLYGLFYGDASRAMDDIFADYSY